jgi:SAM-dependent methyltransferase
VTVPEGFPPGFFSRFDESGDGEFYRPPRLVTHIDDRAIASVGALYDRLGLRGRVLDLMSSWISHFRTVPSALVALGMNADELGANSQACGAVIADLNASPGLPFAGASFEGATCCVSVDYLTRPVEVFVEVARVLLPGATFCCTFSNRCFPTKAIAGWLALDGRGRMQLVAQYFARSDGWTGIEAIRATPPGTGGDPLYAVWATRAG